MYLFTHSKQRKLQPSCLRRRRPTSLPLRLHSIPYYLLIFAQDNFASVKGACFIYFVSHETTWEVCWAAELPKDTECRI